MNEFIDEIQDLIIEYGYTDVSNLCVTLAIEKFQDIRNYPASYDDERILADLEKNRSKIAMAAIEIDSKVGAENQLSMSENGTSRTFKDGIMAYEGVIGYAKVL